MENVSPTVGVPRLPDWSVEAVAPSPFTQSGRPLDNLRSKFESAPRVHEAVDVPWVHGATNPVDTDSTCGGTHLRH